MGGRQGDGIRPAVSERDPRVDAWIEALPEWQRSIFVRLRELIHEADPEVEETIKRTTQPYFVLNGNVAAFLAAKDHASLFLYDPIAPDPEGIITGGHGNATGRMIAIRDATAINSPALLELFRQIIANNRAGGWRKLRKEGAERGGGEGRAPDQ